MNMANEDEFEGRALSGVTNEAIGVTNELMDVIYSSSSEYS